MITLESQFHNFFHLGKESSIINNSFQSGFSFLAFLPIICKISFRDLLSSKINLLYFLAILSLELPLESRYCLQFFFVVIYFVIFLDPLISGLPLIDEVEVIGNEYEEGESHDGAHYYQEEENSFSHK